MTRESWVRPLRAVARAATAVRTAARRTALGRVAWRILVTIIGAVVIVIGIILLPLPGPGWVVIFAGLGVLSTEYEWARRLLRATRRKAAELAARARQRSAARRRDAPQAEPDTR